MQLLQEMKEKGCNVGSTVLKVTCKVLKDNEGALELARFLKMLSCTKHINQMYHHFRSCISSGDVEIYSIGTST